MSLMHIYAEIEAVRGRCVTGVCTYPGSEFCWEIYKVLQNFKCDDQRMRSERNFSRFYLSKHNLHLVPTISYREGNYKSKPKALLFGCPQGSKSLLHFDGVDAQLKTTRADHSYRRRFRKADFSSAFASQHYSLYDSPFIVGRRNTTEYSPSESQ
jgi:hypothetical protein